MDSYTNKEEIFTELVKKHKHEIFRFAKGYVHDDYIADDLAQEAFLELYKNFENVDPNKVVGYIKIIIEHKFSNFKRDNKYLNDVSLDEFCESPGTTPSAEDVYIHRMEEKRNKALSKNILEKLRKKNQEWYDVVVWNYYTKRTLVELARIKGVEPKTIYARLNRAEKWLKKTFGELKEE